MIRYFCDRCGEETTDHQERITVAHESIVRGDAGLGAGGRRSQPVGRDFCPDCSDIIWRHFTDALIEPAKLMELK